MDGEKFKRAAKEDIIREHLQGDSSSKKRRFDTRNPSTLAGEEPEEDAILDLDEIGKGGLNSKRKAVRIEGYDTDSSEENFEARAEARARGAKKEKKQAAKSKDEESNDMFADIEEDFKDADDDEDLAREGKKRKKEVRFLDEDDIEGQVMNSTGGGHVSADFSLNKKQATRDSESESSSDDSADDEERDRVGDDVDEELGAGSKKTNAPKLDAFNMRDEAEEGKFDESGNFVRNANDPFAVHDSWLEGSSKSDIRKARQAREKREQEQRNKEMAEDSVQSDDILYNLIRRLRDEETPLEALARYGAPKTKPKPKWHKNRRKDAMDIDSETTADNDEESRRKEAVEELTAAADQLLARGQPEIYDTERAMLIRQYRRESGKEWVDEDVNKKQANGNASPAAKQWEYRWSDARDGGSVHGPYDGPTMAAWNEAGYFGEDVEFRDTDGGQWSRLVDFI